VVTGGSRGIGLAIAAGLARAGAEVVLVSRNRKALEVARKKLGARASAVAADVGRPADVDRLFSQVKRRHGRLDILVNCAGIFTYKPFTETTLEDWQSNIETNLGSLFLTARAALPLWKESRHAHLVNILSISSRQAFANCSAYTAAKFGALGLTRVLREELQPKGIRVTAILPGLTDTGILREFDFEVPRNRVMQPEDVADAVLAALRQPARTAVNEVVLMPAAGAI
ncbi:MAG TPA: SDR family oxidoreductase, partial [Terriglobia bacterium]|nr:SDR family oxidoreductase [Terriglobia bacterium]